MKTPAKRNRWLYFTVVLVLIIFLGIPLLPLLSGAWRANQAPATGTATASAQRSAERQAQLAAREQGFEQVLQSEPDNEAALRGLVEVRLEQGEIESALPPLERLAERHPGQPDYGILLAQALEYRGDYEGAFRAYDNILTVNPGDINALQGIVNLQLAQDRQEGAIGRLQDTLKVAAQANAANPGSIDVASVQLLLGQVYARQERYTEALAVYDQLITENTQDFRPVLAKATVLRQQSRLSAAKSLFELAVTLAPAKYKDQIKQMAAELPAAPVGAADATPAPETEAETEAESDSGLTDSEPAAAPTAPAVEADPDATLPSVESDSSTAPTVGGSGR